MFRTRASISAGILCALPFALADCAGGSTPAADTSTQAPASAQQTVRSHRSERPTDAQLARFVKAFRRQYPALADGRSDQGIADDAANTCGDFRLKTERPIIVQHVAARFEASKQQAPKIVKLIRAKTCPA